MTAFIGAVSVLAGAALTMLFEQHRQRTQRAEDRNTFLRNSRLDAYRNFLREVHSAAHNIGRTSVGCTHPLKRDHSVTVKVDSEVAMRLYELELFAGSAVLSHARDVRFALYRFRDLVESDVAYMSDEYKESLGEYQQARTSLIKAVREEFLGLESIDGTTPRRRLFRHREPSRHPDIPR